jgi:hypothetical protein
LNVQSGPFIALQKGSAAIALANMLAMSGRSAAVAGTTWKDILSASTAVMHRGDNFKDMRKDQRDETLGSFKEMFSGLKSYDGWSVYVIRSPPVRKYEAAT